MRPKHVTRTTVGSSAWIPVDRNKKPFSIGIGVKITGTIDVTVEHTFDDIQDPSVTPEPFPHPDLNGITANADGNYHAPVEAIRLTVNSVTGGSATMTLIQAG